MEITKNKNPWARLWIFCTFLNPYPTVWFSFWKSQTFGKSLKAFGSQIFFFRFFYIHRLVWIFLWIFGCFECVASMFCLKILLTHFSKDWSSPFPRRAEWGWGWGTAQYLRGTQSEWWTSLWLHSWNKTENNRTEYYSSHPQCYLLTEL